MSQPDPAQRPSGPVTGSIERTLAGQADLRVLPVVREAWQRIHGIKGMVVAGMLLVYGAVLLVSLAGGALFGFEDRSAIAGTFVELVVMIIVYPFMAGVFMLGLRRSLDLPVTFEQQFRYYPTLLPIVAVGLLQSVVTMVGFLLLILPGIYLTFALSLAVPLKAERDLPVAECLLTSIRLVNSKFLEVVALTLIATALMVLGLLSVIGWIWTLPWTLMIFAIIYRQLAGIGDAAPPPTAREF